MTYCADCGDELTTVVIKTRWGASTEVCTVGEVWQSEPARCTDCLDRTREEVDAIVNRIGPLLLSTLWG